MSFKVGANQLLAPVIIHSRPILYLKALRSGFYRFTTSHTQIGVLFGLSVYFFIINQNLTEFPY